MIAALITDRGGVDAVVGNAAPIARCINPAVRLAGAGGMAIICFHSDSSAIDGTPSAAGRSAEIAVTVQQSAAGRPGVAPYPAVIR